METQNTDTEQKWYSLKVLSNFEDKVKKFPNKKSHQIFLEPEGLNDDIIYPNGISSSLPEDIQERFVRSIKGLELSLIHI